MSENLAIIVGNLGHDPELRYTPDGTPVCNMSVATTKKWKDRESGENMEKTTWHTVEAWRKLGENCAEYLKKGSSVYVKGAMENSTWEPVEGITAKNTVIKAAKVKFL